MKQYRVGYGEGRVKCNLATDLAGNLLIDIWHWKCSHCQTWHAYHWNAHAHSSTQFNLALPPPMLTYFNTAWHHFCLLPNTAIECWCPNVQSDPQTMLKVEFHQAGVVCQTSTNMSGYCSVKSTALIFDSLSLVFTLSILSIAQPTASWSPLQVHGSLIGKVPEQV